MYKLGENMAFSILIVEDENDIRSMIEEALSNPDYSVSTAADGKEALDFFERNKSIDLIILDLMLPKIDGLTVLKKIRESSIVPILILSARNGDYEKVIGLEYGADDYITKPFSIIELQARVRAFLRRVNEYHVTEQTLGTLVRIGNITVDIDNLVVKKENEVVHLTAKEFEVLKLFAMHPAKVYTKVQLYEEVWDDEFLKDENVINVTIRRLREKIEDNPSEPQFIRTVWGIGYKLGIKAEEGK